MPRLNLLFSAVGSTDGSARNDSTWIQRRKSDFESHMTVLIVDDNPSLRRLLRRAILDDASSIWECSDGADAENAYVEHRPDIVLMDVRMPGMDGLAATRALRQVDPKATIVFVTDYDDDDIRRAANEAGASGYILKQNLTELAQLLRSIWVSRN